MVVLLSVWKTQASFEWFILLEPAVVGERKEIGLKMQETLKNS